MTEPLVIGPDVDMSQLRNEIDQLDATIADLLKRRAFVSHQIQRARVSLGGARVDLGREREVIGSYMSLLGDRGSEIATTVLTFCRGEVLNANADQRQGQALHGNGAAS